MQKRNHTGAMAGWLILAFFTNSSALHAQDITLVSVPDDPLVLGTQGAGASDGCSLSAQGRYVAFTSVAHNLIPDDHNAVRDVFLKDRMSGDLQRLNRFSDGSEAIIGAESSDVVISADGRVVLFVTSDNLNAVGRHPGRALYWMDRANNEYQVVSRLADATVDSVSSSMQGVSVSADGRYVVFDDVSDGYVVDDTDGVSDVFRYDSVTQQLELVSTDGAGANTSLPVFAGGVSNGGDRVLLTTAENWVAGDGDNQTDVFVKSIGSGTVFRVSVDSSGMGAFSPDTACDLSGNGEAALFLTRDQLVAGDSNLLPDLFLHRPSGGSTLLVNGGPMGEFSDAQTECGFVDVTGANAVFASAASTLVGPVSGSLSPYLKDLVSGEVSLLAQASGDLRVTDFSENASTVCLESSAVDVVAADTNAVNDVFVVEPGQVPERISVAAVPVPLEIDQAGSFSPAMSATGDRIVFVSNSRWMDGQSGYNVVDGPPAGNQVYLHTVSTGENVLLSRSVNGGPSDGSSRQPVISANGRYVAFRSTSTDLKPRQIPAGDYVYRVDVDTLAVVLVSLTAAGAVIEGQQLTVSDTGAVAFMTDDPNLLPNVTNPSDQIVYWSGTEFEPVQVITIDRMGDLADEPSQRPHLSSDGNYLVFLSEEADLVDNPLPLAQAIFVRDLNSEVTQRIAGAALGGASRAQLSGDGRYVVFDRLENSGGALSSQVMVYDQISATEISLTGPTSGSGIESAEEPVISDDGTHALFKMSDGGDQFLIRFKIGVEWESMLTLNGFFGPDVPDALAISNDGTRAVFDTSTNLIPKDTNGFFLDVYRADREPIGVEPPSGLPFADGFEARPLP